MPLDHFSCYEVKREPFTGPLLTLQDTFGTHVGVPLQRPERLCAPSNKNGEDPTAPNHEEHLLDYKIRFDFVGLTNQVVQDQFGSVHVDIRKVNRLTVPTHKSLSGPASAVTNPVNDHFTCYKVRRTRDFPRFVERTITSQDQFGALTVTLKRPLELCAPTNKNGEDPSAPNHPDFLLCYKTARTTFGDLFPSVNNQFGLRNIQLLRRQEYCVPALLNP